MLVLKQTRANLNQSYNFIFNIVSVHRHLTEELLFCGAAMCFCLRYSNEELYIIKLSLNSFILSNILTEYNTK